MDAKDLLPILFERSNAMATLWNIEIAVVLGLIAFLASAWGTMGRHPSTKTALTIGFFLMAALNMEGLINVADQRQKLVGVFRTLESPIVTVLAPSSGCNDSLLVLPVWLVASVHAGGCNDPLLVLPVCLVASVHIVVDLLVVWFIWFGLPRKPQ